MLANMNLFSTLPDDTSVYCAHEYTESNFKFLANVDRELCQEKYNEIRDMRSRGLPTIPTTIGEERAYNLFMRCNDPKTQKLVGADGSPVETMEVLRKLKNEFR